MAFDTMFVNFTKRASAFWLKTAQRLQAAKSAGPGYTANQFAADTAGTVIDALDVWSSVFGDVPAPLVPTILVSDQAAAFALGVSGQGSVTSDVTSATITVTDLAAVGGGAPIPSGKINLTQNGTLLTVKVTTAGPAVGTYQGLLFLGPPKTRPPQPLAQIVVVVV